ncbi:MAG: HAMP domain-containing histidine kinase [Spirochaetales bacterium]|nr:HAMP domain-containing histidine kinase [Spirochaetales bacterium]
MKHRLFFSVLAGYVVVIVLGSAGMFLSFRQAAGREFRKYLLEGQQMAAARAAGFVSEYYRRIGSLNGLDGFLKSQLKDPHMGMGERPMMSRWMSGPGRFVVTDPDFTVIADTSGRLAPGQKLPPKTFGGPGPGLHEMAVPIEQGGSIHAYVIPSLAVDPRLPPEDRRVLETMQNGAFVSLLLVIAVSIAAAAVLTLHVVRPVQAIGGVVDRISRGDYAARTAFVRGDEIGALARGINQLAASLAQAEEWRSQLISDTAHELRTPVSLLSGRLEMLAEGLYTPNPEELAKLSAEVQRLSALIEQLEGLSAFDQGAYAPELKNLDAGILAAERVKAFADEAAARNIGLRNSVSEGFFVRGDSLKLGQVIDNLLSNALRYTPPGGTVEVSMVQEVSIEEKGPFIELRVEDSGSGIAPEYREKVFRRYFRIDKSRSSHEGGRGLGLAIAREITVFHGGVLWVDGESRYGGARFCLRLPGAET